MLRGIAALGVVFYHAFQKGVFQSSATPRPIWEAILLLPISYGYVGVYLFFVISGFCIHLGWSKAVAEGKKEYSVEFRPFWVRRIRRLYPAYLAAIGFYLWIEWFQGRLVLNAFFAWDLISHILMIHNLDTRTVYSLNGVFWTLAIEEQLYLAYFLLLWLRKRLGWVKTLIICFSTRFLWLALSAILHRRFGIEIVYLESAAANWCIWALGAVSVEWYFGLITLPDWLRARFWVLVAWGGAAFYTYTDFFSNPYSNFHRVATLFLQPMWGIASFLLLCAIVIRKRASIDRISSRWVTLLTGVGLFSYSLYLTHEIVFMLFPLTISLNLLLSLIFAFSFFLVFEKPFLSLSRTNQSPLPMLNRGVSERAA